MVSSGRGASVTSSNSREHLRGMVRSDSDSGGQAASTNGETPQRQSCKADGIGRKAEGIRSKIKVLQQKQIFFEMEDQVLALERKIGKLSGVGSMPPALPGFPFDVRLPLPSKNGLLLEKLPNGTFRRVQVKVDWPRFDMIDADSGSPIEGGTWVIQNSVVRPRPHLDGSTGNGSMGCALQLEPRDGSKVATFFAKTPSERDEWCRVLVMIFIGT